MSETHTPPDPGSPPSTPRWVKVFGIIFIILVLVFAILHLTGNGLGHLHGALRVVEFRV
jgi:hypothetical protein